MTTPRGVSFATGLFPAGAGTYEANLSDLPEAPYSAFGPFETAHVRVTGGEVRGGGAAGGDARSTVAGLLAWVERAAGDVAGYYGRFPLPRTLVILIPGGRRAVGFGTTMGNGGGSIMIWVGAAASETDLRRDWVLTHEMVHLGLPNLPRAQHWMEEGLATYVEPIARARHGHLSVEEVWTDLRAPHAAGRARARAAWTRAAASARSTGAARSSGSSPTSRSASGPTTGSRWRTRCAGSATRGAASR